MTDRDSTAQRKSTAQTIGDPREMTRELRDRRQEDVNAYRKLGLTGISESFQPFLDHAEWADERIAALESQRLDAIRDAMEYAAGLGALAAKVTSLESRLAVAERVVEAAPTIFEAGYRIGYANGRCDEQCDEEDDPDAGDAFELWIWDTMYEDVPVPDGLREALESQRLDAIRDAMEYAAGLGALAAKVTSLESRLAAAERVVEAAREVDSHMRLGPMAMAGLWRMREALTAYDSTT